MKFSSNTKIDPRKCILERYPACPLCLLFVNFLTNQFNKLVLHQLRNTICLKHLRNFFIQSEADPKPIVTRSQSFSRALPQLHVITLIGSLDCLRHLWLASDNFGFGFYDTQLKSALNSSESSFLTGWDNSCEAD